VPLRCGQSIIRRQIDQLRQHFGDDLRITVVVGFKLGRVVKANPDVSFVYNEAYDSTNTSKSLLKALTVTGQSPVLWLNGDVVFDPRLLAAVQDAVGGGHSLVCVNTSPVGDEEVKYTLSPDGCIAALSKTVLAPLGEAVGINYVNAADKAVLQDRLAECDCQDYFERGIELAIAKNGTKFRPLDISAYPCVEVDVQDDLDRANSLGASV
jgi:CDP-glycerol glycerophosphotransferase